MRNTETTQNAREHLMVSREGLWEAAQNIGHVANRAAHHPIVKISFFLGGLLMVGNHFNETIVIPFRHDLQSVGTDAGTALRDTNNALGETKDEVAKFHDDIIPKPHETTTVPAPPNAIPEHSDDRTENANSPLPTSTTTTTEPASTTLPPTTMPAG